MRIEVFSRNFFEVNTYFLIEDKKCLVVDPGSNLKEILKVIDKLHVEVVGVILTHAHFDHFVSCNEFMKHYAVPLYVHSKGIELLYDATKNASSYVTGLEPFVLDKEVEVKKVNEETKEIEGIRLNVYHVPGHSPDSICLYFKEDNLLITGDALFKGSIGRTDLYNGNNKQLLTNIKNKLLSLPDETIVYPGHGDKSTIGDEKRRNPFLR